MDVINPTAAVQQPLRAVILDMDGTTIDTLRSTYNWLVHIHQLFGDKTKPLPPYSAEFMENYNQVYAEGGLAGIYHNIIHTDWEKHEAAIWSEYNDYNKKNTVPMIKQHGTHMGQVVHELYERGCITPKRLTRLRLGINTTKSLASVAPSLEKANIYHLFDTAVTYDDVLHYVADGVVKQSNLVSIDNIDAVRKLVSAEANAHLEKPNSLSAMITMYRLGVQHNEFIVFEDTVNGVQAYKPMLLPNGYTNPYVVGVTWGFEKDAQKLADAGADVIMDDIRDVPKIVESLGGFL